jgi:hypothetical protein
MHLHQGAGTRCIGRGFPPPGMARGPNPDPATRLSRQTAAKLLRFPNPVNEVAARVVAGAAAAGAWVTLGTRWPWLLPVLAYGFLARVLTGPTLSPSASSRPGLSLPGSLGPSPCPDPRSGSRRESERW